MAKAPDAFRTISEVADWLGIQAHVLRFWESKFTQVKPIKRAGGRRYYRPPDMLLLGGIKKLLHDDGLTIKGVQKLLREEGVAHVAGLSIPIDDETMIEGRIVVEAPAASEDNVVQLDQTAKAKAETPAPPVEPAVETPQTVEAADDTRPAEEVSNTTAEPNVVATSPSPSKEETAPAEPSNALPSFLRKAPEPEQDAAPVTDNMPAAPEDPVEVAQTDAPNDTASEDTTQETVADLAEAPAQDAVPVAVEENTLLSEEDAAQGMAQANAPDIEENIFANADAEGPSKDASQAETADPAKDDPKQDAAVAPEDTDPVAAEPPTPKPRIIDLPAFTPESEFAATPASLSASATLRKLTAQQANDIAPSLARLQELRDAMAEAAHETATPPNG